MWVKTGVLSERRTSASTGSGHAVDQSDGGVPADIGSACQPLRVSRRATCLLRLHIFNLNNALYSTRPYNEGRRFQCQLIAVNARIEYAIVPGESLI